MIKINLNNPIIGLDGNAIPMSPTDPTPAQQGRIIAEALSRGTSEHSVKVLSWCLKLYAGESLELGPDEVSILIGLVEKLPIQDLLKAQVLNSINQSILNDNI